MNKFYKISILLCFLFSLTPFRLYAQVDWIPFSENPVIDENFDTLSISMERPSIVFDGSIYHMWYGKSEANGIENIGYATSPDGINWTLVQAVVLEATPNHFDSQNASQGWVIADGDTLKMWYWGEDPSGNNIGYAWSIDGIDWTKVSGSGAGGSVYDLTMDGSAALALATPCVIKDQGTYHMWYVRGYIIPPSFSFRIGYATSSDGINWTNVPGSGFDGAVLDFGNSGMFDETMVAWPAVIKSEQGFEMWYFGLDNLNVARLGYAISSDGVNWVRIGGNGTKGASIDEAHFASVCKQGDLYQMWYGVEGGDIVNYATSLKATDVEVMNNIPKTYALHQNYPNPFNPSTTIEYGLPISSKVRIVIYDVLGREVIRLIDSEHAAGFYSVIWDGKNRTGNLVASGIYIYRIVAEDVKGEQKILRIKKLLLLK